MRYRRNIVFLLHSFFFARFLKVAPSACSFLEKNVSFFLIVFSRFCRFFFRFINFGHEFSVTLLHFVFFLLLNVLWFLRFPLTINSISSLLLCLLIFFPLLPRVLLPPLPSPLVSYIAGEYFKIKQKNVLLSTFTRVIRNFFNLGAV